MPRKNLFKKSSRTKSDKSRLLDPVVVDADQGHASESVAYGQSSDTVHNEPSAEWNPSIHVGEADSQQHVDPAITQSRDDEPQNVFAADGAVSSSEVIVQTTTSIDGRDINNSLNNTSPTGGSTSLLARAFSSLCCCCNKQGRYEEMINEPPI